MSAQARGPQADERYIRILYTFRLWRSLSRGIEQNTLVKHKGWRRGKFHRT